MGVEAMLAQVPYKDLEARLGEMSGDQIDQLQEDSSSDEDDKDNKDGKDAKDNKDDKDDEYRRDVENNKDDSDDDDNTASMKELLFCFEDICSRPKAYCDSTQTYSGKEER